MLDENIPPDLIKAYKNSEYRLSSSIRNDMQSFEPRRRDTNYDYYNSTYTALTPIEALSYIGLERNVTANPDGTYTSKKGSGQISRTLKDTTYNDNLANLRILRDGGV